MRKHWKRDPAFWVVMATFAFFLAIAVAVFKAPQKTFSRVSQGVLLFNKEETNEPPSISFPKISRFTIDARNPKLWVYFNLFRSRVVRPKFVSSVDWDLAFKRYHVIANGGVANLAATGGILDLGSALFSRVSSVPAGEFTLNTSTPNGSDWENMAIRHWYSYDYASHILTPMSHVYLVRTPENRTFAFRILDYYCLGGESGCITFEYFPIARE